MPLVGGGWDPRQLQNWFDPVSAFYAFSNSIVPTAEPVASSEDYAALAAAVGADASAAQAEYVTDAGTSPGAPEAVEVNVDPSLAVSQFAGTASVGFHEPAAPYAGHSWFAAAFDAPGGQATELVRSFGAWRFDDVIGFAGSTGALGFALGFDLPDLVGPDGGLDGLELAGDSIQGGEISNGEMPALLEPVLESELPGSAQTFAHGGDLAAASIVAPWADVGDASSAAAVGADGSAQQRDSYWFDVPGIGGVVLDEQAFAAALLSLLGDPGSTAMNGAGLAASGVVFDIADLLSGASPDGAALGYLDPALAQAAMDQSSIHAGSMNDHEMASSVMAIHDEAHRVAMLAA